MKRICDSCKWFSRLKNSGEICINPKVAALQLHLAREICDQEGNGKFVYFEPNEPDKSAAGMTFVQISRDKPKTMAAAAGRINV